MAHNALSLHDVAIGTLNGVSLTVPAGKVCCIAGPSGSGKSRLLRAIADLEPHQGEICLGSLKQQHIAAHHWRGKVMLVPAQSEWWADSVGEHFADPAFDCRPLGLAADVLDWPVSRLSSGEKQRLALARAIACQPRALLLDEPCANLDEQTSMEVEQWLLGLIRSRELPTLWVVHDSRQIARVADIQMYINGQRLEQQP